MPLTLNPQQEKAVSIVKGPLLILAGAGAGKTKTITERIRRLVISGIDPTKILAITFTNKAAREMRERIEIGLKNDLDINRPISISERPFVSTYHALGVHILREQSAQAGLKRHFIIFDRDDSKKAVREALTRVGFDPKTHEPGKLMGIISREKGEGLNFRGYENSENTSYIRKVVAQVWPEYEKILVRDNALDFDDLLAKTLKLLKENREVRDYYRKVWEHIHIDEYQDTNRLQYEISKCLVGEEKNICVVGDIDQNIYSWRGADLRNILDFEKDYPEAEIVVLEENYRSTKTILEAANAVIEKNKIRRKKKLFTSNDAGEKIYVFAGFDETSEAEFIAQKARDLVNTGVAPDEIAVLYRANFQSRVLEEAFLRVDIPYQILGTKFFERKEVKDIVSYLRAAFNPDSLSDLKRIINVPARGIGKTTILKIFSGEEYSLAPGVKSKIASFRKLLSSIAEFSSSHKLSETIAFIIKESGLEEEWRSAKDEGGQKHASDRLANAYELVNFAFKYDKVSSEEAVLAFLQDAALQSDQDELKEEERAVRLMTVHASKGLEFDAVFVAGLEDGLFPHARLDEDMATPEEAEEERRLFYVAVTRARKKLFLTYAQSRTIFGRSQVNIPSPFIFDIPETLLEMKNPEMSHKPLLEIDF